ncbi:MAG TPA: cyclopropane-fatty-acyl-phospholipid synthase family protein [Candidatus Limnocylindrales bacterium]|nr:cyclopropane-fatty-acyl-phospholipid synthase family protein [Candidatus Limnocylindrales bacterium]
MELMTSPAGVERPSNQEPTPRGPARRHRAHRADHVDIHLEAPHQPRRVALARAVVRLLSATIGEDSGLRIELVDDGAGVPVMGEPPRATVRLRGPDAVARILWPPTPDSIAEAYLRGDVDIDGDMLAALEAAQMIDLRRLGIGGARRLARWVFELQRDTPPAPRLVRSAHLTGVRHSPARDMAAIRFHYDVGEDFYRLWLDRRLTYSCAYFERADDPAADLDAAQEAKLDLICRKLGLRAGQRLLDIGCGWGSLIVYAAERHGVEAIGVTLSERQANEANRRAAEAGLGGRVRAEVRDYRDLGELGDFDAVASVGMFEHVGRANLVTYFQAAYGAVRPGGRFLNHGIAQARPSRQFGPGLVPGGTQFGARYVFPDGELVPVEVSSLIAREAAGFELLDVQLLRPHYALTLSAWVARLEAHWDEAVATAGTEVARTWRLYMSAAQHGFAKGELEVAQLLLARPEVDGPAPRPLRPWW